MQPSILPRRALLLLLPPIALCALDMGLTLFGQPEAYWAGDYSAVREQSPSFAHYLSIHPAVFCAAAALWIIIFSLLILLLPEMLALLLSVAVTIGHMAGAATWLIYRFNVYQLFNVLFLVTSGLVVFSIKFGQASDGRSAIDWARTGLPPWVRWLAIAVLIILPCWWFLIPRCLCSPKAARAAAGNGLGRVKYSARDFSPLCPGRFGRCSMELGMYTSTPTVTFSESRETKQLTTPVSSSSKPSRRTDCHRCCIPRRFPSDRSGNCLRP
jgi:hypothetical protein